MSGAGRGDGPAAVGSRQGFGLTLALLGTLLAGTLVAQLPSRFVPSWLSAHQDTYAAFWPQGWSFFAAEPGSQVVTAYRITADGTYAPVLSPQMSGQNLWGVGRDSASKFLETALLARLVPARDWIACAGGLSSACAAGAPAVVLADGFQPALLCGPTVFVSATVSPSLASRSSADDDSGSGSGSGAAVRVAVTDLRCGP